MIITTDLNSQIYTPPPEMSTNLLLYLGMCTTQNSKAGDKIGVFIFRSISFQRVHLLELVIET